MSQDSGQPVTTPSIQTVPEPPRPVTARVRRRSWAEPQVRGWALLAAALLLGSIVLSISSVTEWLEETNVVRNGVQVDAVAWHLEGSRVKGMSLATGSRINIEYEYQGKTYKDSGLLYNTGVEYVSLLPFKIRIDPEAPANWTNRTDAPPVIEKMMGVGMMLSVVAICAVVLLLLRYRRISLWVDGDQVTARIIGHSQSALAPHSVVLRCAMRTGKTERLVSVYVPQQLAPAEGAQTIELIVSADRSRALALANYHP